MPHVDVQKMQDCCGCAACADVCPKQCIKMAEDAESFRYPTVDKGLCIDCGRCLTVCPVSNADKLKNDIRDDEAFAFVSKDTLLVKNSSSGGAFSVLMDAFTERNADNFCIAGAAFRGTEVVHICVDEQSEAERFRKSKYVQSNAVGVYRQVKQKLEENKAVLFSGTPCMVAGLKAFLGKPYENLLTVDIVCHGVPSQAIFSDYLSELSQKQGDTVEAVSFKAKRGFDTDTPNPRTVNIDFKSGKTLNLDISQCEYLYGFYTSLYFRPSCHNCRFTAPARPGDITLGDFWGIEKKYPNLQSKKGVSLVRFNTDAGKEFLQSLRQSGDVYETSYMFACEENDQLLTPPKPHRNRGKFMRLRRKGVSVTDAVNICKKPDNFFQKVYHKLIDIETKILRNR